MIFLVRTIVLSALITVFQLATPVAAQARMGTLKPYVTDGCTGFAEGTKKDPNLWAHCCAEHDLRYWFGGSDDDMDYADLSLRACVREVAGEKWARIIYDGVIAGHSSPIKNKYHWSWGWKPKRKNLPLTEDEIDYVKVELHRLPMDPESIEEFIAKYLPRN
jgi:hypothetical protein